MVVSCFHKPSQSVGAGLLFMPLKIQTLIGKRPSVLWAFAPGASEASSHVGSGQRA